jgi:hypothetical protein
MDQRDLSDSPPLDLNLSDPTIHIIALLGVGEVLDFLDLEFSVLLSDGDYEERIVIERAAVGGRAHG